MDYAAAHIGNYNGKDESFRLGHLVPNQHGENAMSLFTRDIKTMEDLFLHTLQDVYYAENQIVKSLPTSAISEEAKRVLRLC